MADFWRGNILLPNGETINDVSLASSEAAPTPKLPPTPLRFLSTVNTARIPLYLAAGPSFEVWTSSEDTQEWFYSLLSSKTGILENGLGNASAQDWWSYLRSQSPIGILARVDVEHTSEPGQGPRVTEILFYGTISKCPSIGLPTPPRSSNTSPGSHRESNEDLPQLRVHALPLSSDLLLSSQIPDVSIPLKPAGATENPSESQYLSSRFSRAPAHTTSPKKKRDIFEEATQARKKAKRKGGESISAAAARFDNTKPTAVQRKLSIDIKGLILPDLKGPNTADLSAQPRSRTHSRSGSISHDARPSSRKGLLDGAGKRSSLSQVANVPVEPEEPTIESRNKEALSRVVMAAMRMYGLQQRKKTNRSHRESVSVAVAHDRSDEQINAEEAAKDEEYKLIYHQTFKGAALALRKHIKTKPLHPFPDILQDTVEKLLAIFCVDPLTEPLPTEETIGFLTTPSVALRANPFDAPSSAIKTTDTIRVPVPSPTPHGKHT
ncbi:hypothetical protein GQ43DRAFT_289241 [Delitschia confertaspora ATCC 74209]|uniref:Sld7 C-terminal domain-containing protein n=1 Tax=Delitschia confertaspora ATCC 74209 TaxID=1513339 RepID=A0A9P4MRH0_9PLEO|nr:hypothetical protein GQ43DRAFT_289241 [Delitschia confertaspora ATCC 74209]